MVQAVCTYASGLQATSLQRCAMLLCCFNPVAEYFGATSLLRATDPYPTTV